MNGKPWDPKRMLIEWNGTKWTGNDIPDFNTAAPGSNTGPFIMQPEGLGRLLLSTNWRKGRSLNTTSRWKRRSALTRCANVVSSPVVRIYEDDVLRLGKKTSSRMSALLTA